MINTTHRALAAEAAEAAAVSKHISPRLSCKVASNLSYHFDCEEVGAPSLDLVIRWVGP